jgi:DDE superfamily endonuclease
MSHTGRLRRYPSAFRRLTGTTPAAFDRLLADPTPRYERADAGRECRPGRRRPGAGREHDLGLADRLLMPLISYRTYTTRASLGSLLGVDDSAVGRDIDPLQPLLAGISRIPERRIRPDPEEVRELFFDATERPARRPTAGRRAYDSGKKGRHTIKNRVVTARRAEPPGPGAEPRRPRIAAASESSPGSARDEEIYDRTRAVAPPDARRAGDTAYLGTSPETPAREPKGGESTTGRRRRDRAVSRRRIVAEHGIGKMKVWRIASGRYRNPSRRHTPILKDAAGLHNLMDA